MLTSLLNRLTARNRYVGRHRAGTADTDTRDDPTTPRDQ